MKNFLRTVAFGVLAVPFLAGAADAQGDDLAVDFKMSSNGGIGVRKTASSSTGHLVVSNGSIRMDVSGMGGQMPIPGISPNDPMSMIMSDTGKAIIYMWPKTKQFMRFNPIEMVDRMQKIMEMMGAGMTMKFEVVGDPQVERVGAGPDLLGHKTEHYRVSTSMKMTVDMAAQGESVHQVVTMKQVQDHYFATDIPMTRNPFTGALSNAPGMTREVVQKLSAASEKLPKHLALKSEVQMSANGEGMMGTTTTVTEVTGVQHITASKDLFQIPADYKEVEFKMPSPDGIPPA